MKKINNLLFILFTLAFVNLNAQNTRYVDAIFDDITVTSDVVYGSNISVLTGTPAAIDLLMDVYEPTNDDVTDRPVFIVVHTGSFLPQYFNGQVTGGKLDSVIVNTCKRLASRGFVAVAMTYRQGWLPTAPDQNARTSTLLQASYRGIQDLNTCTRFLRKTVAEDDNPYGVSADQIASFGFGTGGYISLGAAYLDRVTETHIDKFIDTETLEPYINEATFGDPYATVAGLASLANWPDYSSDISYTVNCGGALGDLSWIEGNDNEPASTGFHVVTDPFGPFADGAVIVPTTGEFVVNVSGTWSAINKSNEVGNNDILDAVNANTDDALNQIVNEYKTQDITTLSGQEIALGIDNMYPFVMPGFQGSPWDWWDKPTLDFIIPLVNMAFNTMFESDQLHNDGLITSPDMSADQGNAYLDTIFHYMLPRACNAFELESCMTVGVDNPIDEISVGFKANPIPANDFITLSSKDESPMQNVYLFDITGKVVRSYTSVDASELTIQRKDLPSGTYIIKVKFKEGWLSNKVLFK